MIAVIKIYLLFKDFGKLMKTHESTLRFMDSSLSVLINLSRFQETMILIRHVDWKYSLKNVLDAQAVKMTQRSWSGFDANSSSYIKTK